MPDISDERIERPFRGHLIVAERCRWYRTTDVHGKWRVSTIGDYWPVGATEPATIGCGRLYETMVFALSAEVCNASCCGGAPKIVDWVERDFAAYNSASDAERGHEEMVAKWLATPEAHDGG